MKERAYPRSTRIADLIKQEVASMFLRDLSDPRLQNVTITNVKLSKDLKTATVYYVLSNANEDQDIKKSLEGVKGFVRKQLSQKLNMRRTPELNFCYDDVFEHGMNIERILRSIKD